MAVVNNKDKKVEDIAAKLRKKREEREGRVRLESTIGLDTFSSDLNTTNSTLSGILGGWQSSDTMNSTKADVEKMYNRLGAYEDYRKNYGDNSLTDLSELLGAYESTLGGWDDLTFNYNRYKNVDEYNEAQTALQKAAEETKKMETEDLGVVKTEIGQLEELLKNAEAHESKIKGLENRKNTWEHRSRGLGTDGGYSDKIKVAETEYSDFLSSAGYTSYEEVKKALEDKKVYLSKAELLQNKALLASVADINSENYDKDFEKYAEAGKAMGSDKKSFLKQMSDGGFSENDVAYYREHPELLESYEENYDNNLNSLAKSAAMSMNTTPWAAKYMTDEEYKIYNYYYGKGDKESAEKYLDSIKEDINNRQGYDMYKDQKGVFEKFAFGYEAGIDQFKQGVTNAFNFTDDYIPASPTQVASSWVREDIRQNQGAFGQGVYDLTTTTANMLPSILASTATNIIAPGVGSYVGAGLMGLSASGNAYQEMLNLGYSKGQARNYSVLVGASEAALEKVLGGISALGGQTTARLTKVLSKVDNGLARFALNVGASALSEGFEEGLQEVLTPIFKDIAVGVDTGEEVNWDEVVYSALLGAVSGGLMESGPLAVSSVQQHMGNVATGKDLKAAEQVGNVFDIASMSPEESEAYEAYTRYSKKGITAENISNAKLGNLYNTLSSEVNPTYRSARNDMSKSRIEIAQQKSIRESETSSEKQKSKATAKLDKAISNYNEAQTTIGKYGERFFKLSEVANKVSNSKYMAEKKAEAKKISADVETSVMAENNEAVDFKGVKFDGKDTKIITNDGEVSINDVKLSEIDSQLITIAKDMDANVASAFVSAYDRSSNVDIDQYLNDFNLVAGYALNWRFTPDYILQHKGSLSAEQVTSIYENTVIAEARKKEAEFNKLISTTANNTPYKGIIDDSIFKNGTVNYNRLSKRQKNAIQFLKVFAAKSGMNLTFEPESDDFNGWFEKEKNTLHISVGAGIKRSEGMLKDTIIPTASHEITHWMEEKSPELWEKLKNVALDALEAAYKAKTGKDITQEDIIATEIKNLNEQFPGEKHTADDAITEIVARCCEDMLAMSEEGRKMFNSMSEAEQKTFKEKVMEIINNLKEWINELLSSYGTQTEEAMLLRNYKDKLEEMSKIWDEMLVRSIEVNQALEKSKQTAQKNTDTEGGVSFSLKNKKLTINSRIPFVELKNYINVNQNDSVALGKLEGKVNNLKRGTYKNDATGYQADINSDTIRKALNPTHKKFDAFKEKHIRNLNAILKLPELFKNAVYVDSMPPQKGKIQNPSFKEYHHFVAPLFMDNSEYRAMITAREKVNSNTLYVLRVEVLPMKKRYTPSTAQQTAVGSQLLSGPSDVSIAELINGVKIYDYNLQKYNIYSDKDIKFSLKDTENNTLTEQQQNYFADSKVRDENGNLKVMYRGDANEFTVFDRKKSKPSNLYGRGFYFTDSKAHAEQYGKATAYYLDIKNPLSPGQNSITKAQMLKFLKVIENDGEDYDLYNYGEGATAESVLKKVWGKDDFAMLQDINAGAIGDLVAAVELFNEVNGTNYDGLILPTETVTFASEQAKLTSNKKPTNNPDIRFSLKKPVEQTKELVAVHNLREEKLLKSLNLGGLPMPSIAIVRAREGHNSFGDISLVFRKETIDPKFFRSNKVYSGDAWTPTYPQIEYKVNEKAQNSIKKKIDSLVPGDVQQDLGGLHLDSYNVEHDLNRSGNMVEPYRYNYAMKYAFLKDNDINIELPTKEKPLYRYGQVSNNAVISFAHKMVEGLKTVNALLEQHSSMLMADADLINGIASVLNEEVLSTVEENTEAYQEMVENPLYKPEDVDLSTVLGMLEAARRYFYSSGQINSEIDYREAKTLIDEKVDMAEYESWLKELFTDIVAKEGIRNNKDTFTPSGSRRSFEALHYEHNLENVIKAMKEEGSKGIGGFGGGNIFGASTREYGSIDDIKADASERLKQLPESEFEEIKKGFSDRFYELASSLPIHKESFTAVDDAANMLIEAVLKCKTKSGMANYIRSESKGWANYSEYVVDDLIELVEDIRSMPVGYFEAKPLRAVGFDEVATAIIPDNTSEELKTKLTENNVSFVEYENGNEESRLEALNSLENVKFSVKKHSSVYDVMGETERLRAENEQLRKDFADLQERLDLEKQLTHGNYFNENSLGTVAGHLRKISNSSYDKVSLIGRLKEVYSYIAHSENVTWDEMFDMSYRIAEDMLKESKPDVIVNREYKRILSDIRNTKISLDDTQISEAKYRFGNHYNRAFFNKVHLTSEGISLDTMWQDWAERYPDFFDASVSSGNQIGELYDIIESLQEASEIVEEYDMEEQARWLATEIYNQYWNVSTIKTTADKYDRKIKLLNYQHRNRMNALRESYNARLEKQKLASEIHYGKLYNKRIGKIYNKLREQKEAEVAHARELGKQRMAEYKESIERKTVMQSMMGTVMSLNKKLTTNSKDVHIPEDLKPVVINLLNAIDFSSKQLLEMDGTKKSKRGTPTKTDLATENALSKVHSLGSEEASVSSLKMAVMDALELFEKAEKVLSEASDGTVDSSVVTLDVDMIDSIKKMIKELDILEKEIEGRFTLQAMRTDQLKTLNRMVKSINHWAIVADKALANKHKERISDLALQTINENNVYGERQEYIKAIEDVKNFLNWSNVLPVNAFKRLGGAATRFFDSLRDSQDKLTFNRQEIMDFTDALFKGHKIKEWRTDVKEFTIKLPNGKDEKGKDKTVEKTVRMPISYIMSLYCVSKQEDAKRHLLGLDSNGNRLTYEGEDKKIHDGGGITISGFKDGKLKVSKNLENTIISEDIIKQITSVLTNEQKDIADKLQEYMNSKGSEWGNAVSEVLYGIKKFDVENYFPITVSPHTIHSDQTKDKRSASFFSIINYGFSKERNPNAKQSIEISDIFDVFANHMNMVAIYNAYALSLFDIARWHNFKGKGADKEELSVTKSIEKAFGKGATTYLSNLIKDLNGQHESSRLSFISALFKNAKVAMVGNSFSVTLLQPTAYFRAMTSIPPKYLLKAALHVKDFGAKNGVAKAKKYCGIALLKSQGYFETGVSANTTTKMLHDESFREKAIEVSLKGAEWMDERTWGLLWNACEFEIRAERKDLKVGSEEFFEVVGEKLRDVIYETQVVDSPLTKSDIMRSPDMGAKSVTMFASEMTISYNMVLETVYDTVLDYKKNGKEGIVKRNGKRIVMVLTAQALTSAANAIATTAVQALRDDDDEEKDIEAYLSAFLSNFASDILIVGKIPYLKDTISFYQGFSSSRPESLWLESAFKAYRYIDKLVKGDANEDTLRRAIDELLKTGSYFSGYAAYNAWRELRAILNKIGIL